MIVLFKLLNVIKSRFAKTNSSWAPWAPWKRIVAEFSLKRKLPVTIWLYRNVLKIFLSLLLLLVVTFTGGILSFSDIETNGILNKLPEDKTDKLLPEQAVKTDNGFCYGISRKNGFLVSTDSGKTWITKNNGLPTKLVYPAAEPKVRTLTGFGVDPSNSQRVAVLTASSIFLSEDAGTTWQKIPFKNTNLNIYLTAVALAPADKNTLLIGTSFAGIFETGDRGQTWRNISENLRFLYQGAGFWEEIAALAYLPEDPDTILFACGFGNGLYRLDKTHQTATPVDLTALNQNPGGDGSVLDSQLANHLSGKNSINFDTVLNQLSFLKGNTSANEPAWLLEIGTANGLKLATFSDNRLTLANNPLDLPLTKFQPDQAKQERLRLASGKFGIYLRSDHARGKALDGYLQFMKKYGFNALVVDFKDDSGYITYDTQLSLPYEAGAVRAGINIKEFIQKTRENGIYVIGRVVVFQDPKLHRFRKYKYAVWNKVTNAPWSTREYWVDPFCDEVWDYNLAIAVELQSLGVDEIQFDYIRFPTDGDIGNATFRYRPAGADKTDALESFLAKARERLTIPISTDLYGFNCWSRVDSVNGQNLEMITNYVDVICPMFYPSHFMKSFMPGVEYLERARRIYSDGSKRAFIIAGNQAIIRPYVQAFLLGGETKMAPETYQKYLQNQLEGVAAGPTPGFTLWNYANKFFMVAKPVAEYLNPEATSSSNNK